MTTVESDSRRAARRSSPPARGVVRCAATVLTLLLLAGAARAAARPAARPNVVLLVVDDVTTDDVRRLPGLQQMLFRSGTELARFVVPNALCGPSRASILRGQYGHNTGIRNNRRVFAQAYDLDLESSTVATWLHDAGYATGLFGKYLNGYGRVNAPVRAEHVPPGWTEWYAGTPGLGYGFWLSHGGKVVRYPQDGPHANDVLADLVVGFVERHAGSPMFLYLAPGSSHGDAIPAHRHEGAFADAQPPRRASFDEADVDDKPAWIRRLPALRASTPRTVLQRARNRLRSLLSVEDLVASLMHVLAEHGLLENTYFIFLSDNGYHYGEHRIRRSKATAYEESIVVPAAIRGPGVPAGDRIEHLATNADLAVTIAELAGVAPPQFVDGKSLVPLLRRDRPSPDAWRRAVPLERLGSRGKGDGPSPDFFGLRHRRWKYVVYPQSGDEEIYDTERDPFELQSLHANADPACLEILRGWARALSRCAGQECRDLEQHFPAHETVACSDPSTAIAPSLLPWSPATVLADMDRASDVASSCVLVEASAGEIRPAVGDAARGRSAE